MFTSVADLYTADLEKQIPTERSVEKIWTEKPATIAQKTRVAAYCRVSTDKDEQLVSLENQMAAFRYTEAFTHCTLVGNAYPAAAGAAMVSKDAVST